MALPSEDQLEVMQAAFQTDIDELEKALEIINGVFPFYRSKDGIADIAGLIGEQIALRKYEIEQNKRFKSR